MRNTKYEQYLVKLAFVCEVNESIETHYASGIIFKPFEYSQYLYIFTAKHTFEKEVQDKEYPDDIQKVLFDDEYIKSNLTIDLSVVSAHEPNKTKELYPSELDNITKIHEVLDKELDLLIFEICIKDKELEVENINPLGIYKSTLFTNHSEVIVAGFPNIRGGIPYGYSSTFYRYYDEKSKIYFEVKSNELFSTKDVNEFDAIKGISGGGVFIEKENEVYLIGIEIEYQSPNSFKCIHLNTIYKNIRDILKFRIDTLTIPIELDNGKFFNTEMVKVKSDENSIYISVYPVTFDEYDLFCDDIRNKKTKPNSEGFGRGRNPVINVSWNDAISYCEWLSKKGEYTYRLLSLYEWRSIVEYVIFNEDDIWYGKEILEVDKLNANNLGLYHFYGNVNEWCRDDSQEYRIAIGGSYRSRKLEREMKKSPSIPSDQIGFRTILVSR